MNARIDDYGGHWLPDYFANTVEEIDFEFLRRKGIRAMLFDLDHTILSHGSINVDSGVMKTLTESDMKVYIATNRRKSHDLDNIKNAISAEGIMFARGATVGKPSKAYYKLAVEMTDLKTNEVAMVGDRLVQDIWGANRTGLTTVMVGKFGNIRWYDQILTVHDRIIPKLFKKSYQKI